MREDEGERRRWHARAKERGSETKRDAIDSGWVVFFFFFFLRPALFFSLSQFEKTFFSLFLKRHTLLSLPHHALAACPWH